MTRASQRIPVIIGLLTGALFLWLALRNVHFPSVLEALMDAELWYVLPFLTCLALFYWLKAVRWSMLLRPTRQLPARAVLPSLMIGFAGNNVLPLRLGELVRVYILRRQEGISGSTIFGTVVLERVLDVATLLLIIGFALSTTSLESAEAKTATRFIAIAAFAAVLVTLIVAVSPKWANFITAPVLARLPPRIRGFIDEKFALLRQGFAALTASSFLALGVLLLNSLAQWVLMTLCIYIPMLAFGLETDISSAVLVLALIVAGISLPSAPGYVGTIEYCFVLGLGLANIDPVTALGVGIYYHAVTFLAVTLSGAWFLKALNMSVSDVASKASAVREGDT